MLPFLGPAVQQLPSLLPPWHAQVHRPPLLLSAAASHCLHPLSSIPVDQQLPTSIHFPELLQPPAPPQCLLSMLLSSIPAPPALLLLLPPAAVLLLHSAPPQHARLFHTLLPLSRLPSSSPPALLLCFLLHMLRLLPSAPLRLLLLLLLPLASCLPAPPSRSTLSPTPPGLRPPGELPPPLFRTLQPAVAPGPPGTLAIASPGPPGSSPALFPFPPASPTAASALSQRPLRESSTTTTLLVPPPPAAVVPQPSPCRQRTAAIQSERPPAEQ